LLTRISSHFRTEIPLGTTGVTTLGHVIKDTQEFVVVEGDGHRFGAMDASLACCALETRSALLSKRRWVDEELDGLVLLVSGTISQKLAPALLDLVAVGACATSGGPYWDSQTIVAGLDALGVPCDLYIPGCPPRPAEILAGVVGLLNRAEAR
jgi:NADH-quinone oxidoreductase subunit B